MICVTAKVIGVTAKQSIAQARTPRAVAKVISARAKTTSASAKIDFAFARISFAQAGKHLSGHGRQSFKQRPSRFEGDLLRLAIWLVGLLAWSVWCFASGKNRLSQQKGRPLLGARENWLG
jgi:hypothetical protein